MKVPIDLALAAGEYMDSATVMEWLKKPGEKITEGETIVLVETAKATSEVVAPVSGILVGIEFTVNQEVKLGKVLGWIETDESLAMASFTQGNKEKADVVLPEAEITLKKEPEISNSVAVYGETKRVNISPVARKMAEELGVDITKLIGSGPGGRIIERDITAAGKAPVATTDEKSHTLTKYTVIPATGYRRATAQHMVLSASIPQFQLTTQINMAPVLAERQKWAKEERPTITAIFTKATGKTIEKFPRFNSLFIDNEVRQFSVINIGVAVATQHGLAVPVVKAVSTLSVQEINRDLVELRKRAENQRLTQDDVSDGAFTISNLGQKGIVQFSALVNPPQVAILAFGTSHNAWLAGSASLQVSQCCLATISCDHRALDGADGAEFLYEFKEIMENPESWL